MAEKDVLYHELLDALRCRRLRDLPIGPQSQR